MIHLHLHLHFHFSKYLSPTSVMSKLAMKKTKTKKGMFLRINHFSLLDCESLFLLVLLIYIYINAKIILMQKLY